VLAGIPNLLAAASDAGPVPADVAGRIDEALAAEPPVLAAGSATVTPLAPRREAPMGMRMLQAAAVLVVALAGIGLAITARDGGNDSSTTAAGSAGKEAAQALPDDGSFPVTTSGRDWTQDSVVAAVPELLTGSTAAADGAAAPTSPTSPSAPSGSASEDAGPSDDTGVESSGGATARLSGNAAGRLAGGPPLAECVTALNDDPVTPLAVDLATWAGQPAAIILLPTPGDPTSVDEWVVAPDCSIEDAKVLYFARVARP